MRSLDRQGWVGECVEGALPGALQGAVGTEDRAGCGCQRDPGDVAATRSRARLGCRGPWAQHCGCPVTSSCRRLSEALAPLSNGQATPGSFQLGQETLTLCRAALFHRHTCCPEAPRPPTPAHRGQPVRLPLPEQHRHGLLRCSQPPRARSEHRQSWARPLIKLPLIKNLGFVIRLGN